MRVIAAAALVSAFGIVMRTTPQPPVLQFKNGDKINLDAGFIKPEDLLPSYDGLFTAEFVR